MKKTSIDTKQKQLLLLAGAAFLIFYAKLWNGYLGGDEACYALLARQILRTGDWIVLHHPYYAKWSNFYEHPPLYMWVTALNFKFFGISDCTAKLFSATSGLGMVIVIYLIGKKLVNHVYGYSAAFILLTTQYFLDIARKARLDVPLTFFLVLGFYFLILSLKNRQPIWALGSGIATALAFLTKGIPALSIVVVAVIALTFFSGSVKKFVITSIAFWLGLSLILVPWIYAQFVFDKGRFFDWYFYKQVSWSMSGRSASKKAPWHAISFFYIRKLLTQVMVPWFTVAIFGVCRMHKSFKEHNDKLRYLALSASIVVISAFSFVMFKKTRYILPVVPFLSLLGAEFFINRMWTAKFISGINKVLATVLVLILVISTITNIPFSLNMNTDLISLRPYVETYSVPIDSLLVVGMREYSVRQIFSWYFDRPQKICTSNEIFFNQWQTGAYKIGIRYQGDQSTMPNDVNNEPQVISGSFQLFVNKLEAKKVLLIQKNK